MFNTDNLQIIPGTDIRLREKAKEVADPADPLVANLVKQMTKTLQANNGVGLAAPQVGQAVRIFVAEIDYELYAMINPKIKNLSRDTVEMEEGCLSFPGVFKPITRSKKVTVTYFDLGGEKKTLKARGLLARVIQHEYDHLDGVLFVDLVKRAG
ncbi:MAG: peptide deformylase [Patescibacteria group bacterium]|nr:peptide deformylase [Patescibacteria group bacterium]